MASVLFTNVRILDGTGASPYPGEVLVQGNRISRVARGARALPTAGVTVVDGGGATLMPGLVEAHTRACELEAGIAGAFPGDRVLVTSHLEPAGAHGQDHPDDHAEFPDPGEAGSQ